VELDLISPVVARQKKPKISFDEKPLVIPLPKPAAAGGSDYLAPVTWAHDDVARPFQGSSATSMQQLTETVYEQVDCKNTAVSESVLCKNAESSVALC
jgi:hypothetical protein